MQGKLHYHPHRTLAISMPTNSSCTLDTQEKCHTHCSTYRSATIKKSLRTPLCRNSYPNFILDTLLNQLLPFIGHRRFLYTFKPKYCSKNHFLTNPFTFFSPKYTFYCSVRESFHRESIKYRNI